VLLTLLLPHFLFMSQRSPEEEARPGLELPQDDEGLPGLLSVLCASHLSTESARPGLGLEAKEVGRMMRHGAIVLIGGVGSRPGRSAAAALAIARSTDAMDDDLLLGPRNSSARAGKREMRLPGNEANRRSDGCGIGLG
jgi:hypothetical protein